MTNVNKEVKMSLENLITRCFKEIAYIRREDPDREIWYTWHVQTLKDIERVISQIEVKA